MSSKNTWLWIAAAAVLFAFIFLFEHFRPQPHTGPVYLLPNFDPKSVLSVQIRPAGQPEIRAQRANGAWQLIEPVAYPAQGSNIEALLNALQHLTVAHRISDQELRNDRKADEDYGIEPPEMSLVLGENNSTNPVYFGHRTSPGDQVFVRVVGVDGVSIVDADILNFLPPSANAWRDTTLVDFARMDFDRITVTNVTKSQSFLLVRDTTNRPWAMVFPMKSRADNGKINTAIQRLEKMRVRKFISDDPKADFDTFGLQPPALTLTFAAGTNNLFNLDFGKGLTNSPGLIYARLRNQSTVVAVSTNVLGQWNAPYDAFRDRHLVSLTAPIESIQVQGQDSFSLQWQTNDTWRVMPEDFPADPILAAALPRKLSELQVADFVKDSVTDPDLPHYGLAPSPARKFIIKWAQPPVGTNPPVELDFGTNNNHQIFARRLDEDAVYGMAPLDFDALPSASWEMRDRRIWNFDVNDVARVIVQQDGRTREVVRNGTNGWSLAAGSTGSINDSAIEDTTRELGHLSAFTWVGHGAAKLPSFGFTPAGYQLSVELKNGGKLSVQFGGTNRLDSRYASVLLNGEPWIFEFPPDLYSSIQYCLAIPPPSSTAR